MRPAAPRREEVRAWAGGGVLFPSATPSFAGLKLQATTDLRVQSLGPELCLAVVPESLILLSISEVVGPSQQVQGT